MSERLVHLFMCILAVLAGVGAATLLVITGFATVAVLFG
jgi:hypothetical protein